MVSINYFGDVFPHVGESYNEKNRSPTSQSYHLHDVAYLVLLEIHLNMCWQKVFAYTIWTILIILPNHHMLILFRVSQITFCILSKYDVWILFWIFIPIQVFIFWNLENMSDNTRIEPRSWTEFHSKLCKFQLVLIQK